MNTEWNLDILYKGLDDPAYEEDINKFQQVSTEMVELVKSAQELPMKERAEKILYKMEEVEKYAIANKFAFIRANSGSKRIEAHEVYRKLGFDSEKEQKRFLKKIDMDVEI